MSVRRGKWHPPPAPTPMILHLPRRSRLSRQAKPRTKSPAPLPPKPNLEELMRQESRNFREVDRRARVEPLRSSSGESSGQSAEEGWRFQAEVLRAECNFLRMEREIALRKVEKNRSEMETALRSAVEALVSGKEKIDGSGSVKAALDEGIEELQSKIDEIQGGWRLPRRKMSGSVGNFDRRASVLRRRLERMVEETCVREIREVSESAEPASSSKMGSEKQNEDALHLPDQKCQFPDVEKLRRKMERLSRGMREMEKGFLVSSSNSTAAAGGNRRPDGMLGCTVVGGTAADRRLRLRPQSEEVGIERDLENSSNGGGCCNSKELLEKIMEQVMSEEEQWGEMQAMLDKVKSDMENLRSSRDLWEHRAMSSDLNLRSLSSKMLEWKRRALDAERAEADLRKQIDALAPEAKNSAPATLSDQLHSEICKLKQLKIRERQQRKSSELRAEKEKIVRSCRFVDLKCDHPNQRSPLREIRNQPSDRSAVRTFR
ncbi:hypothetical protein AXF42_Ash004401 [Apostasia shenzhenica]|uniref:Uncharacterized protein n=1 Tax=Apostasia shenzhenica TaxID=1088818 RepID=A0A2I0A2U7_9ASPA|nr:hypothetical protein AXF42_Ash004401 [Apostasia shenzhenica]